jgi:hypothetical protein
LTGPFRKSLEPNFLFGGDRTKSQMKGEEDMTILVYCSVQNYNLSRRVVNIFHAIRDDILL